MTRFRSLTFGRDEDEPALEAFTVTANDGLNMRAGPGVQHEKIKKLARGTMVSQVETDGRWWMVAELVRGREGDTGWVHSNWLTPA